MEFSLKKDKEIKLKSYKDDARYQMIKNEFLCYFKKKIYLTNDYFDINIWFLSGDKILKKIIQNNINSSYNFNSNNNINSTPMPISIFHEILFQLNENKDDLKNLKINVNSFLERIAQELLFSHELRERSQGLINQYKAYEMINLIEQNKAKIRNRYCDLSYKFSSDNYSKIHFMLKNINNFPIGVYTVESEFIELCDKESDRKTAHTSKTIAGIFENKKIFLINKKIIVEKDKAFLDFIGKKEKQYYIVEEFEIKKFMLDDRDLKIPNFSGTTLHKINVNFYKENGELLGQFSKNFVVLLLMSIEKLADIRNEDININIISKLETDLDNCDHRIEIDFFLKLDSQTRISILENIFKILTNVIEMNSLYNNTIFDIMSYFGDIRESIEIIMNSPKDEKKEICNACECIIL